MRTHLAVVTLLISLFALPLAATAQNAPADTPGTYTSTTFGWSVTFDPQQWVIQERLGGPDQGFEGIRATTTDGAMYIELVGTLNFVGNLQACIDAFVTRASEFAKQTGYVVAPSVPADIQILTPSVGLSMFLYLSNPTDDAKSIVNLIACHDVSAGVLAISAMSIAAAYRVSPQRLNDFLVGIALTSTSQPQQPQQPQQPAQATQPPLVASGDSDYDTISDADEIARGMNPYTPDSDGDGMWDPIELQHGTDPTVPDTDGDGILDAIDFDSFGGGGSQQSSQSGTQGCIPRWRENIVMPPAIPVPGDIDGDGLSDTDEAIYGTNPNWKDTDNDQFTDGNEVWAGTDPLDPCKVPY